MDYMHPESSHVGGNLDWLLIQCRYSSICSEILHETSEPKFPNKVHLEKLQRSLESWTRRISFPDTDNITFKLEQTASNRLLRLQTAFQHHEAIIAIGLLALQLPVCKSDNSQSTIEEACISSARDVLSTSCHITMGDILYDWLVYPC